jgi:dihydrofolate reductase
MIRLIAAVDSRNGIAKNGIQPWDIPEDLAYFKRLTKTYGANVLMGYKTFLAIGNPLEDRNNYIVSQHHLQETIDGAMLISDLNKFLSSFSQDVWIVGGEQIYRQTIAWAQEIYLTKINHDYSCDQFFPKYKKEFRQVFSEEPKQHKDVTFNFNLYKRI